MRTIWIGAGCVGLCLLMGSATAARGDVIESVRLDENGVPIEQLESGGFDYIDVIEPSVTSSSYRAGVQTMEQTWGCRLNGQLVACTQTFTIEPEIGTGGHDHDQGSRPLGTVVPSSGFHGPEGITILYTAPEAGGSEVMSVSGVLEDGTPTSGATNQFLIEILGLDPLGAGTNYDLIGATSQHGDNHYGTSSVNEALKNLADLYAQKFPMDSKLAFNDMSLEKGGIFDISGVWTPPHRTHRFGTDIDLRINSVPSNNRDDLERFILAVGISQIFKESNPPHWHLRQ